jgi:hypothetical protein
LLHTGKAPPFDADAKLEVVRGAMRRDVASRDVRTYIVRRVPVPSVPGERADILSPWLKTRAVPLRVRGRSLAPSSARRNGLNVFELAIGVPSGNFA